MLGMTYDVAVWKGAVPLSDEEAGEEFVRRCERRGRREPACPELVTLFARMRTEFPHDPPLWEGALDGDLAAQADGDFIYICMPARVARDVIGFIAELAGPLGLVVYDPQCEAVLS